MCFNQDDAISLLNDKLLKLVDQFINLDSIILSIESDGNVNFGKLLTAINRLMTLQKSNLSNKIKWEFFQAVHVAILLYGCTT